MITRHTRGKVVWIDLEAPTHEELGEVMAEFNIDSRVESEIITPTPYPLTLSSPLYQYLILHFPTTDPNGGTKEQEMDFIVGKDFLITCRYEVIDSIHTLHRVFEAEELIGKEHSIKTAGILEQVLRRLYGAIREEMERAARNLDRIERDIFSRRERQAVRTISEAGRILLRFDTILARQEEPLDAFLDALTSPAFLGKSFVDNAAQIRAEHDHVATLIGAYRKVAQELRWTNDSLLSASQNEISKKLTTVAFFIAPPTFVTSLFGMNVVEVPFAHHPYGFWIIMCLTFVVTGLFYLLFRLKKIL